MILAEHHSLLQLSSSQHWPLMMALCRCAADFFTYTPPGGAADVGYDYT
jgi:hypothetical protein